MRLNYIDHPVSIPVTQYEALKTKLVKTLLANDAVLSVYQMGSVKHPGISDLDIICVFKKGGQCAANLRPELNADEQNILTHGVFGVEEPDLQQSMSFNLISNLKHLGGKNLNLSDNNLNTSEDLKRQIALEYLVKMLITIDAQVTMKIIKLRAFLLLAKAIEFDLQLLNVNQGKLYDLVQQVIQYRNDWYANKPNQDDVSNLILNFNIELRQFLKKELQHAQLYLPRTLVRLPGNFSIQQHKMFSIEHKGMVLPYQLSFLGRKYINLQNRLNSFTYKLPFEIPASGSIHEERFQFSENMVATNRARYPYFLPLTTSLGIY
ncbi:hypothetical protein [uncultured Psychroserpens sp.]|uniref:hypothetical protein n=1 Tax=uncultured Psychroserpens sp. TaxID=255436 RepID=UPI0026187A93|nr:hypothetical protein [uncultured Psychroserpens sp.]